MPFNVNHMSLGIKTVMGIGVFVRTALMHCDSGDTISFFSHNGYIGFLTTSASDLLGSDNFMTNTRVYVCSNRWERPDDRGSDTLRTMYGMLKGHIADQVAYIQALLDIPSDRPNRTVDRDYTIRNMLFAEPGFLHYRINPDICEYGFEEVFDGVTVGAEHLGIPTNMIDHVARQISGMIMTSLLTISFERFEHMRQGQRFIGTMNMALNELGRGTLRHAPFRVLRRHFLLREGQNVQQQNIGSPA